MMRRVSKTGWTHASIVVAMAYAFVLQILLLSVSGAFHAAAAAEPQGIICVQSGASAPGHPSPAKTHDGLCCTLSCHGSASVGPIPAAAIPERLAPLATLSTAPWQPSALRQSSNVLPVGSRAPPRLG